MGRFIKCVGVMLILAGAFIIMLPYIRGELKKRWDDKTISEYDRKYSEENDIRDIDRKYSEEKKTGEYGRQHSKERPVWTNENAPVDEEGLYEYDGLTLIGTEDVKNEIDAYNEKLLSENIRSISDAWAYETTAGLEGLFEDDLFGYIDIPVMECRLPLYLGASYDHMDKGAAVLGGTSVPSGKKDTNSVIAAHRGWEKGPYFLNIERLSKGDIVCIKSIYGELTYEVCGMDIIEPDDLSSLGIHSGKDMITLMTCHPYMSHGRYRYIVYCMRSSGGADMETAAGDLKCGIKNNDLIISSDGQEFRTSGTDIKNEMVIRKLLAAVMLTAAAVTILTGVIGSNRIWRSSINE